MWNDILQKITDNDNTEEKTPVFQTFNQTKWYTKIITWRKKMKEGEEMGDPDMEKIWRVCAKSQRLDRMEIHDSQPT